jgi:hypothetical protein
MSALSFGCGSKSATMVAGPQVVTFAYSPAQAAQAKQAAADITLLKGMSVADRQAYVAQHPDVEKAISGSPSQLLKLQFKSLMAGKM